MDNFSMTLTMGNNQIFWGGVILLASHFIGDYVLQTDYMAKNKDKNLYILFIHSFLYTCIVSMMINLLIGMNMFTFAWLLVGHMVTDYAKCKINKQHPGVNQKWLLALDQVTHLVYIAQACMMVK